MSADTMGDQPPAFVIYARESVRGRNAHRTCAEQIELCKTHIQKLNTDPSTFEVIQEIARPDGSRPGFDRVMEYRRQGRLAKLVVSSLDRLGRTDGIVNLLRDIVHAGDEVIAVMNGLSTGHPAWVGFVRSAPAFSATWGTHFSKRVRTVQRRRAEAAMPLGPAPFGYAVALDDAGRKRIVVDPSAAAVIRELFERVAKAKPGGRVLGDATRWLNALAADVRGPLNDGRPVSDTWVRRTLTNAKYAGDWTWGRTVTTRSADGRRISRPADPTQVVVVRRPELAVVTDALFARVQAVLAKRTKRAT